MAKHILSAAQIKGYVIKPGVKIDKSLHDGQGLYLWVYDNGMRRWILRYRIAEHGKLKQRELSLGVYDEVSLSKAREKADEERALVKLGIDPNKHKKEKKAVKAAENENTFELVAAEWFKFWGKDKAESTRKITWAMVSRYLLKPIGNIPIKEVTQKQVLRLLEAIQDKGSRCNTVAHTVKSFCSMILKYGARYHDGVVDFTGNFKGVLQKMKKGNNPAIIEPDELAGLLAAINTCNGADAVVNCLRLTPLLMVRPIEVTTMRWADLDLVAAEWRFITSKKNTPHIVPLSWQAIQIIEAMKPVTGETKYVFASPRVTGKPITKAAINEALIKLGYYKKQTAHGFRATARTLLDEVLGFPPNLTEHQLSHKIKDPLNGAYNRTTHLPERKAMMQIWADYLTELRTSGKADVKALKKKYYKILSEAE